MQAAAYPDARSLALSENLEPPSDEVPHTGRGRVWLGFQSLDFLYYFVPLRTRLCAGS